MQYEPHRDCRYAFVAQKSCKPTLEHTEDAVSGCYLRNSPFRCLNAASNRSLVSSETFGQTVASCSVK